MIKCVGYRSIQKELELLLHERKENFFPDELSYIFDKLIAVLTKSDFVCLDEKKEYLGVRIVDIVPSISQDKKRILKFIDYYMNGKLSSCLHVFYLWWNNRTFNPYNDEYEKTFFYRMRERKKDEKVFRYEDLLHIPFDKRGIIGNQRYSINGFPCLYVSTSLYESWEELRRPHLQNLYAIAIAFTKSLKFLDLRLVRAISSIDQLRACLLRLPLILACSIKVMEDSATFKPEYIIPQTLLHSIRKDLDGILYTSLRKDYTFYDPNFDKCSNNDNIVLPVKTNKKTGHCEEMMRIINVSETLNFEHEIIKGDISANRYSNKESDKYENTLMGQMEKRLKQGIYYIPINSQGLKGTFGINGLKSGPKHKLV